MAHPYSASVAAPYNKGIDAQQGSASLRHDRNHRLAAAMNSEPDPILYVILLALTLTVGIALGIVFGFGLARFGWVAVALAPGWLRYRLCRASGSANDGGRAMPLACSAGWITLPPHTHTY